MLEAISTPFNEEGKQTKLNTPSSASKPCNLQICPVYALWVLSAHIEAAKNPKRAEDTIENVTQESPHLGN